PRAFGTARKERRKEMNLFIVALGRVSEQAALLVLLVLLVQRVFKSRLSPGWRCALWLLPALRLLLPVSFSSGVSLFNLAPAWHLRTTSGTAIPSPDSAAVSHDQVHISQRNFIFPFNASSETVQNPAEPQRKFDPPSPELSKVNRGLGESDL